MKKTYMLIAAMAAALLVMTARAQDANSFIHRQADDGYEWPDDPDVLEKLQQWQTLKFGVLFHWGLYSVPGIVESWQICSEDWITRPGEYTYEGYKQWYWGLSKVFNPVDFDPQQWADVCGDAGMKYMIFTTKHHDGFCMFDSQYTDFSIAKGPFGSNPKADVSAHVFDTFRSAGFMVGAYFSKPDWHCEWYWNPYYATPRRIHNYKIEQHPDWWTRYQQYANNQLEEITTKYAPLDILWLDGGWVAGEDVYLDQVLQHARTGHQKGLLAVDRLIKGRNENYQTPEQSIPDRQIDHPWESCITLSHSWAWAPDAKFKTPSQVVNMLAEIVAKGGSLALGIGPTPQGLIQPEIVDVLREIGCWMRRYGEAIYDTRITPLYHQGNLWFTEAADGSALYAVYALPDGESVPATLEWTGNLPNGSITIPGRDKPLNYTVSGDKITVKLPKDLASEPFALRISR